MSSWHISRVLGVLGLLACAGCHATTAVPIVGIGPMRVGDATLYDDALAAVRESGHTLVQADPAHGRFAVRARTDPTRRTLLVVQCSRDGYLTIHPEGGDVVRRGDEIDVSPALRTEWLELALAIEAAVPEVR
ncbi:MAG: hypothetical protein U0234_02865 [Sandaracinus sp.]